MGKFNASLRTLGDRRSLPATITLVDDAISITAGEQEIGSWALEEVRLEATSGSVYRMEAEGDHILIEFEDVIGFRSLLDETSRMKRRPKVRTGKRSKSAKPTEAATPPVAAAPAKTAREPKPDKVEKQKPRKAATGTPTDGSSPSRLVAMLDRILESAERRWGSLLPVWVFTRATALALLVLLLATVFLPGPISTVILVVGMIGVLFGAVAYTDMVIASKWLPGRMTPMHVLLGGVGLVMLGVLLGMIA